MNCDEIRCERNKEREKKYNKNNRIKIFKNNWST